MRRAEKEVKDLEQLEEILRDCNTVRIGTQDAEGMFIVPVNYGYDLTEGQLTLYLHSAQEGRKAAAFRRGGAVAFEMDCGHQLMTAEQACSYSCAYRSIMGSGTIRELTEPQEKYAPYDRAKLGDAGARRGPGIRLCHLGGALDGQAQPSQLRGGSRNGLI